MRLLAKFLRLTSILLSVGTVCAQEDTPRGVLQGLKDRVQFVQLDNGIRVIMYPRGQAPVFSGAIGVRVGGTDESLGETGISHMFEHMAFKGTDTIGTKDYVQERKLLDELEMIVKEHGARLDFPPDVKARWEQISSQLVSVWDRDQFVREVKKRGATELNATTDKELTRYFMSLPRSAFEFWCWIESERLLHPVLREFYQERDVVMEEKRMRYTDDPGGRLYETLLQLAYLAHPYRNPVIGHDEDLHSLTATMLEAFRRKYYVGKNIAISIVGSVEPDKDVEIIRRYFGRIAAGQAPVRPNIVEPPQLGERQAVVEWPAAPQLLMAYHKPNYPHPDDPPLSLAVEMFAGSKTSPLYIELVKRRQLAADVGAEEGPGSAYPNLQMFYATTRSPHSNQEVLKAFDDTLRRFLNSPLKEEDLVKAKRRLAVENLAGLKSNLTLAVDFITAELLFQRWDVFLAWYDEAMAVTLDDVKRTAKKYLVSSNRTISRLEQVAKSSEK
ncbi:MAG: insulinase family protein [Oligoflexia bacterium]|nr:insulinase family protein [Oligoflexia bacterium]